MSSTQVAISGYQSLTQVPDWPCCLNLRWQAEQIACTRCGPSTSPGGRNYRAAACRQFVQRRLGVEQVDVAGPAVHETPDDRLRLRLERRERAFRPASAGLRPILRGEQRGGAIEPKPAPLRGTLAGSERLEMRDVRSLLSWASGLILGMTRLGWACWHDMATETVAMHQNGS